jgi:hypothetical protein
MALHPCPRCDRHVQHSEPRCPFCGESLPAMSADSPLIPRMTRAAMWLGTAMALGGAPACERNGPQPAPMNTPPRPNPQEQQAVQAIYGAPPPPDVPNPPQPEPVVADAGDASAAPTAMGAAYGAPPPGIIGLGATRYGAPPVFDDLV